MQKVLSGGYGDTALVVSFSALTTLGVTLVVVQYLGLCYTIFNSEWLNRQGF